MAPDSVGTWWCEDTKRQQDSPTTQSWTSLTRAHTHTHMHIAKGLKPNALEIYLEAIDWNEAGELKSLSHHEMMRLIFIPCQSFARFSTVVIIQIQMIVSAGSTTLQFGCTCTTNSASVTTPLMLVVSLH